MEIILNKIYFEITEKSVKTTIWEKENYKIIVDEKDLEFAEEDFSILNNINNLKEKEVFFEDFEIVFRKEKDNSVFDIGFKVNWEIFFDDNEKYRNYKNKLLEIKNSMVSEVFNGKNYMQYFDAFFTFIKLEKDWIELELQELFHNKLK